MSICSQQYGAGGGVLHTWYPGHLTLDGERAVQLKEKVGGEVGRQY